MSQFAGSSTCAGAAASVATVADLGCDASGYVRTTCVTGAFVAPTTGIVVNSYTVPSACPPGGPLLVVTHYPTGLCIEQPFTSMVATCSASNYSLSTYMGAGCGTTGTREAPAQVFSDATGCAANAQGSNVVQCLSPAVAQTGGAPRAAAISAAVAAAVACAALALAVV